MERNSMNLENKRNPDPETVMEEVGGRRRGRRREREREMCVYVPACLGRALQLSWPWF